jgi:deferrochelatase/peroxidase EfeB
VAELRAAFAAAGRDATSLQVQAPLRLASSEAGRPDLERSMESVPELLAAGATDVHVTLRAFARDPADAPKAMNTITERFRDATR